MLMDRQMSRFCDWYRRYCDISTSTSERVHELDGFPIERARFYTTPLIIVFYSACLALLGLTFDMHIAFPLALLFLMSGAQAMLFNINSTFLIDLFSAKGASIIAVNNLLVCSTAGGAVVFTQQLLNMFGVAIPFVLAAIVAALGIRLLKARGETRSPVEERARQEGEDEGNIERGVIRQSHFGSMYSRSVDKTP